MCEIYLSTLPDAFTAIDAKIHRPLDLMWDVDECSGWVWRQHFYMGIFLTLVAFHLWQEPDTINRARRLTSTIAQLGWIAMSCGTRYSVTFCANCQSWLHSQLYQLKASPKLPWIQGIWKCKWYEYPLVLKDGNGKPPFLDNLPIKVI